MPLEDHKNNPARPVDDEIDLAKVFSAISRAIASFFKNFIKFLFLLLDTVLSKLELIITCSFIGALLGIGYFLIAKPYYESTMTLSSAYYKEKFLSNTINNLNRLALEENYNVLARLLRIPVAKAQTIRKVDIEPTVSSNMQALIDLYKETDGNKMRLDSLILNMNDSTYQLTVQVYDTTTLVGLDTILVNYIKSNRFVDKRIAIERRNSLLRKEKLIRESRNLDTLKNYMAQSYTASQTSPSAPPNGTNVTLNSKEVNPIDVYREDFRLYEQMLKIDKELYINSEIEIIDRFITFGRPVSGTIINHALKGAIIGLGIALIYVFIIMLRIGITRLRYNINS